MPNWFYYNELGTRAGPVTAERLKLLVSVGTIKPETIIETENGQQGYAKNVKELFQVSEPVTKRMEAPLPSPPPVPSPSNAPPMVGSDGLNINQKWFYYENNGTKVGPLSPDELKFFMGTGVVTLGRTGWFFRLPSRISRRLTKSLSHRSLRFFRLHKPIYSILTTTSFSESTTESCPRIQLFPRLSKRFSQNFTVNSCPHLPIFSRLTKKYRPNRSQR